MGSVASVRDHCLSFYFVYSIGQALPLSVNLEKTRCLKCLSSCFREDLARHQSSI